jgi:hypothetical protein
MQKILPNQARTEGPTAGGRIRHISIELVADQTIAGVLEDPALWTMVQGDTATTLTKGAKVTLFSKGGDEMADEAIVKEITPEGVWFHPPARIVELKLAVGWEDDMIEIIPRGNGYTERNRRTGRLGDRVFQTMEACKADHLRRRPKTQVA